LRRLSRLRQWQADKLQKSERPTQEYCSVTNTLPSGALTAADYSRWVDALRCQPRTESELLPWIEGPLRAFSPFQRVFCAHGEHLAGEIKLTHWIALGHTPGFLQQLATTFELRQRTSLAWWLLNRQPLAIDPDNPADHVSSFELQEIRSFDLMNVAAHGTLNVKASTGTYFSFAGVTDPGSAACIEALRLMAPILNDLFVTLVAAKRVDAPSFDRLTPRQLEIIRQVALGHDDKTISRLLGIADRTVRNQLSGIYEQLGIRKRTQLIALMR
jgi:DNA-binding CsgD family transcriptional regulator